MQRVIIFLPSILILLCISVATYFYLRIVLKRFGNSLRSVQWNRENEGKVVWLINAPSTIIFAPAVEELIFRAPLIIAFSDINTVTWYWILISSLIFGLAHLPGRKIWMSDITVARENNSHMSDDVSAEADRINIENKRTVLFRRYFQAMGAFILGILTGYYGIKHQSIWVAFGIHALSNLFLPTIIVLLGILFIVVITVIQILTNKFRKKGLYYEPGPIMGRKQRDSGKLVKINLLPSKQWLRRLKNRHITL